MAEVPPTLFDKALTVFYYVQFKVASMLNVSNVFLL